MKKLKNITLGMLIAVMAHYMIEMFFKKAGLKDGDLHGRDTVRLMIFTYCELAISLFFAVLTYLLMANSTEDLSVRLYGALCFITQFIVIGFMFSRTYHRSHFRDMYQRSREIEISENLKRKIAGIIKYHLIISNVFVLVPALYTISFDKVHIGDQFTFPYIDILPIKTTSVAVYACKYVLCALAVYFAEIEICFLNVTYMHSTGVVKNHFRILVEQIEEAIVNQDEHKLKIAIKHHQEVLKFFKEMKTVHEKQIFLVIIMYGLFIGLTSCLIIQIIQGFVHHMLLELCILSNLECNLTIIIYCIYATDLNDLHDRILNLLFQHKLLYSRNKSFKQLILIMMTRATTPLEFKAGSIFIINNNLLVRILKFAYTVFNVLLTSINHQLIKTAA